MLTRATNGDLLTYLQKAEKFEEEVARFYTAELVHAVEHMHMLGVIHRDLKPENILLTNERHILITDFGSAKIIPQPPFLPGKELVPDLFTLVGSKIIWIHCVSSKQTVSPNI